MNKELQKHIESAARQCDYHYGIQEDAFISGATFIIENKDLLIKEYWKDANGEDLPEFDREVIALQENKLDNSDCYYQVVFAHRPTDTIHIETYDKGGWNIPDIKWWLDLELPIEY